MPKKPSKSSLIAPPVAPKVPSVMQLHGTKRYDDYAWMEKTTRNDQFRKYIQDENKYLSKVMPGLLGQADKLATEVKKLPTRYCKNPLGMIARSRKYTYHLSSEPNEPLVSFRCFQGTVGIQDMSVVNCVLSLRGIVPKKMHVAHDDSWMVVIGEDTFTKRSQSGHLIALFKANEEGNLVSAGPGIPDVYHFAPSPTGDVLYVTANFEKNMQQVKMHKLGDDHRSDVVIFEKPFIKDRRDFDIRTTSDFRFAMITSYVNMEEESEEYTVRLDFDFWSADEDARKKAITQVTSVNQHKIYFLEHHDERLWFMTGPPDESASTSMAEAYTRIRLWSAPDDNPLRENWEKIPELQGGCPQWITPIDDYLGVTIRTNGRTEGYVRDRETKVWTKMELPFDGMCGLDHEKFIPDPENKHHVRAALATHLQLFTPVTVDLKERKVIASESTKLKGYDPDDYIVKCVHVPSGDVQVPLGLVYHKSVSLDSAPPTYLGCIAIYDSIMAPLLILSNVPLMRRGWVLAFAWIRGSDDISSEWRAQGRGVNKPSSVDDLIACAEYLIDKGWATSERLALGDMRKGGMSSSAALTRRPDLFRAGTFFSHTMDVVQALQSSKLKSMLDNKVEFGHAPTIRADYEAALKYSPYDNLKSFFVDGKTAPSVLVYSSTLDTHSAPWQSAKWVAKAREVAGYSKPVPKDKVGGSPKLVLYTESNEDPKLCRADSDLIEEQRFALRNAFLLSEVKGWKEIE
ncbi:hypothetical protein FBU59_000441 [Linderina macrospora]|uniref:Uncharacterized protein n=1 Tax=Linderina macrospora TaxID=4868 RepID=A0ACC1JGV1_9FUNG|nr:hypothetical protein FBU59_000441 [Linderina macrospora]